MASLTIRKLEEPLKARLRIRAATHGNSMATEAREILRAALYREPAKPQNLAEAIREHFARHGGVDLEIPSRDEMVRDPPSFD